MVGWAVRFGSVCFKAPTPPSLTRYRALDLWGGAVPEAGKGGGGLTEREGVALHRGGKRREGRGLSARVREAWEGH